MPVQPQSIEGQQAGKITAWVRRAGWVLKEMTTERAALWGYYIQSKEGSIPLLVYCMSNDPTAVILQVRADTTAAQAARIDGMHGTRDEFFLDLQTLLLKHHVDFLIDPQFKSATVMQRIYPDGLTEDRFWRDVNVVRCAGLDTLTFFRRNLGGTPLDLGATPPH